MTYVVLAVWMHRIGALDSGVCPALVRKRSDTFTP
jgi:hypothetical protein